MMFFIRRRFALYVAYRMSRIVHRIPYDVFLVYTSGKRRVEIAISELPITIATGKIALTSLISSLHLYPLGFLTLFTSPSLCLTTYTTITIYISPIANGHRLPTFLTLHVSTYTYIYFLSYSYISYPFHHPLILTVLSNYLNCSIFHSPFLPYSFLIPPNFSDTM